MVDRASSSRSPQGDRLSNRSHQDSRHQSARDRHPTTWGQQLDKPSRPTDQQASTSSGLDNDTSDKWQKHFQVLLDDYRFCLNDVLKESEEIQDKVIEEYKQEFERANESKREEYVKNLRSLVISLQPDKFQDNEQIAIHEKLGYFLKSKYELLTDVREAALEFLTEKILNGIEEESDRLAEFRKWTHALDDYCTNHEQRVTNLAYRSVVDDIKLLYENNLSEIIRAQEDSIYQDGNQKIYDAIVAIHEILYPSTDNNALMDRRNRRSRGTATVSGGGSLIRAQFWQIFERIHQIVRLYRLEHGHRPQSQERQRPEQRYEVIDVSHTASPQIIDLGEVLRQQLQRMWRRMLRSDA